MNIYRQAYFYIRVIADLVILLLCYELTFYLIPNSVVYKTGFNSSVSFIIIMISWFLSSSKNGIYDEFRSRNFSYEFIGVIKNCFVLIIGIIAAIVLLKEREFPRRFIFVYPALAFFLLTIEKYLVRKFIDIIRLRGRNLRSILIIGAGTVGKRFHHEIMTNPHFGYKFIGFLDDSKKSELNGTYLGPISELDSILESNEIDNVMIALPNHAFSKITEIVKICERYPTRVRLIPDYFQSISSRYSISMFGNLPVISIREDKINDLGWRMIKRGLDTGFALLAFVLIFSWLFPLIAIFIRLDSEGPVFYKQERWGRNNRRFYIYKFRSMNCNCSEIDENGKYRQASKNDIRITRFGKFLRKTNFDELPQFWNVLKGEISIVGPRPHPTPLNLESKDSVDKYMRRHLVKPGITGWAQVHGLRGETKEKSLMQRRVEYDIWYIENWSIWLDLQIIFLTIWRMIKGDPHAY
ncbi:MAG: undecaprenyl-phosphate glucose phosphotransferase [Ignavibacteriales bacterium]|nr:undecaprenyl-phosphate glucose phosphotransferase [Ignavibacteriales bacterium]